MVRSGLVVYVIVEKAVDILAVQFGIKLSISETVRKIAFWTRNPPGVRRRQCNNHDGRRGAARKFFDAPVTDAAAVAALNVINDACLNGTRRDAK